MRLVSGVLGVAWLGVVGGSARCGGGRAGFRAFFFRGPFPQKKKKHRSQPVRPLAGVGGGLAWCGGWLGLAWWRSGWVPCFFFSGPLPPKKKKAQIPARPSPCWCWGWLGLVWWVAWLGVGGGLARCWGWLGLVLGVAWLGVGSGYTYIYIYKQTVLKLLERPFGPRPKKKFLQKKTKKKTNATLFSLLFSW